MNIDPKETYGLEKKEIDYKKLYEQAKAKLDKIEYEGLKLKINADLSLKLHLDNRYDNKERRKIMVNKDHFTFLGKLYCDEDVDKVIKEIGWEKLTKIIDDVYKEVLDEEAQNAEEPK